MFQADQFNFSFRATMLERKQLYPSRFLSPFFQLCLPRKSQSPCWQGKNLDERVLSFVFWNYAHIDQFPFSRMVKNLWRALTPRITIQRPREGANGQEIVDIQLDSAPLILLRCAFDEQRLFLSWINYLWNVGFKQTRGNSVPKTVLHHRIPTYIWHKLPHQSIWRKIQFGLSCTRPLQSAVCILDTSADENKCFWNSLSSTWIIDPFPSIPLLFTGLGAILGQLSAQVIFLELFQSSKSDCNASKNGWGVKYMQMRILKRCWYIFNCLTTPERCRNKS